MPVETAADRLTFLSASDFGVSATYMQAIGPSITIPGILDRQHLAVDASEAAVTGFAVTFMCRADDLAQLMFGRAQQGDEIMIGAERWEVVEPQPDGTGMVMLILRKAAV